MARQRKLPPGLWKRGSVYYARFKSHGRGYRDRLSSNLTTACQLLNELRARADRAEFDIIDNNCPWSTLKTEFMRWIRQGHRRPREYEADLERLEKFRDVRSIQQVTMNFVLEYRHTRLNDGVCPRTVNKEISTLRNMLNRGIEWRLIGVNPIRDLKDLPHDTPTKQRRALEADEVLRIFAASPEHLKPDCRMFMCSGIRRSELVELRWQDIDFEARCLVISAARAKSRKPREVPLDDGVFDMLVALREKAKDRCPNEGTTPAQTAKQAARFSRDHVFVTKANTPLRNNLLTRFYAICKRAGIEGAEQNGSVDIHSLRVTFTTLAIDGGANPKAVQEILGHSTLQLTMGVYNKVSRQSKRAAVAALPFATTSAPEHVIPVQKAHTGRTSSNREISLSAQTA